MSKIVTNGVSVIPHNYLAIAVVKAFITVRVIYGPYWELVDTLDHYNRLMPYFKRIVGHIAKSARIIFDNLFLGHIPSISSTGM